MQRAGQNGNFIPPANQYPCQLQPSGFPAEQYQYSFQPNQTPFSTQQYPYMINPQFQPMQTPASQLGKEKKRTIRRLGTFQVEKSYAYQRIKEKYGELTHATLIKLGKVFANLASLKVDRDATRNAKIMVKWFDENWEQISNHWDNVDLCDENLQVINRKQVPPQRNST